MTRSALLLCCCCCLLGTITLVASHTLPYGGKKWALLVAGSKGFDNYRHQADVCHAYQILHANGIPDENIIVMMYDDIAQSPSNPTPGIIINEPNGRNMYEGVPKDYVGEDLNSTTFLAVLQGDHKAVKGIGSGRVLESGPHDHVFVNFVDHGAPGFVCMPSEETSDYVRASVLLSTLQQMSANNMFAKLVLYVEACESGSMFDSILPDDMNIFVVTAADPHESSWACYYDEKRETLLGDVFSVNWMQETEQEDLSRTTLHHQFEVVRTRTNTSHVEEYGDLNVGAMLLRDFIGLSPPINRRTELPPSSGYDAVPSRDVPLIILERKIEAEYNEMKKDHLKFMLHRMKKLRHELERRFKAIVYQVVGSKSKVEEVFLQRARLTKLPCYERSVEYFDSRCLSVTKNTHALSQLYVFVNLCEAGYPLEDILDAIKTQCESYNNDPFITGIN